MGEGYFPPPSFTQRSCQGNPGFENYGVYFWPMPDSFVIQKNMTTTCSDLKSSLPVVSSLKKRADFLRVQSGGKKWVTPTLIVQMAPHAHPDSHVIRYGLTVTKKIYKKAVDRNRVKRRLRPLIESAAREICSSSVDIVLIARAETLNADYTVLYKDLKWALKRLGAQNISDENK